MTGIDADYALSEMYQSQSWPSFVVIDQEGIVRFHGTLTDKELSGLRRCLDELLAKNPVASGGKPVLLQGMAWPADVLACRQARRDRSPRLAFDRSGNPCVVFYSNREGTNAIYLRRFNRLDRATYEQLSPPAAECYAADCTFDSNGTLWVVWCGMEKGIFDIFVQSRPAGVAPATQQLTFSIEDAMSPRIAAGPDGTVTVVYYKWRTLWGSSRDRDIFARTYVPARHEWRPEIEISPHAPEVEDHTDPDVAVDRQANSWIVWSYDYHPSLYAKPLPAEQPTIFAARAETNTVSRPFLVGATGRFRNAIDLFPSAVIDERGVLWCAWDCSEPSRGICLARFDEASRQFQSVRTFGRPGEVCSTPELAPATTNRLLLSWSQWKPGGRWQGKVILLEAGQPVAETVLAENADVLFPQAEQSPDGQCWVAYERSSPQGSDIVLRNVTPELRHAP